MQRHFSNYLSNKIGVVSKIETEVSEELNSEDATVVKVGVRTFGQYLAEKAADFTVR